MCKWRMVLFCLSFFQYAVLQHAYDSCKGPITELGWGGEGNSQTKNPQNFGGFSEIYRDMMYQVFIDPTFFGVFVCGPLQSLVVNFCTISSLLFYSVLVTGRHNFAALIFKVGSHISARCSHNTGQVFALARKAIRYSVNGNLGFWEIDHLPLP